MLTDSTQSERSLGYNTLSAAEVVGRLAEVERKNLSRYPVPCFRMCRLACRSDRQSQGLGKLLLGCAVDRCLKARQQVSAYALIVDAKDDAAKDFYLHFGFKNLLDAKLTLYLPVGRRSRESWDRRTRRRRVISRWWRNPELKVSAASRS